MLFLEAFNVPGKFSLQNFVYLIHCRCQSPHPACTLETCWLCFRSALGTPRVNVLAGGSRSKPRCVWMQGWVVPTHRVPCVSSHVLDTDLWSLCLQMSLSPGSPENTQRTWILLMISPILGRSVGPRSVCIVRGSISVHACPCTMQSPSL